MGGQNVAFVALPLDRPDPPEPARLDLLPWKERQYTVELLVLEQMTNNNIWWQVLDAMVDWFNAVPGGD